MISFARYTCVGESDRDRETDRLTDIERETETDRDRETERKRECMCDVCVCDKRKRSSEGLILCLLNFLRPWVACET